MKKYSGVLKRVREIEAKKGINYAKTSGALYKGIKIIYLLAMLWAVGTSVLGMIGFYYKRAATENYNNLMITIAVCSALVILGYIINCFKGYITSAVLSILPSVMLIIVFGRETADKLGFWGFKPMFYWRHLIPLALMILTMLALCFIAVREKIKTQKLYKKVLAGLYEDFKRDAQNDENGDEGWEEFLKNYEG